ncbi:ORC-CDC6 family AAA ATPase [Flagellimonas sp. 2504JD4-2]
MSSLEIKNLNESIMQSQGLFDIISSKDFSERLNELSVNWESLNVNPKAKIYGPFIDNNFINIKTKGLTNSGALFIGRVTIDFDILLNKKEKIDGKYTIIEKINIGKNSCTFKAEHSFLGHSVVLKFIRPGASENVTEALKLISNSEKIPNLVQPIDFFRIEMRDVFKNPVPIECVVFPFVSGVTLREFLHDERIPLNAFAISSFIRQVGGVLEFLESLNAYHGDLHDENIIVKRNLDVLSFYVIDVSFGVNGSKSARVCRNDDLTNFRRHVWSFLSTQQKYLSKMSVRKYLGEEIFSIVSKVLSETVTSFKEIISLYSYNVDYQNYLKSKKLFLEKKFLPPGSFKLQRYEEITDQSVALRLFHPFNELMNGIKDFRNTLITGNRGSGKSTHLAAIAFFPRVEEPQVDFRNTFGIYFPCRQGEFRVLSSDMINYDDSGYNRVKHVIIIKIIRRTLEALIEGIESRKINEPQNYDKLKKFLEFFTEIIALEENIVSEIRNLVSIMIRTEMKQLDNLFKDINRLTGIELASELHLIKFFQIIQELFGELSATKFHLLFDDAGNPNLPKEAQRIINDFIISSNSVFCIQLSTEKYSYELITTKLKHLENGQDFIEYDLSSMFYTGSKTYGLKPQKLDGYFEEIVRKRLKYFNYRSEDINEYLGEENMTLEVLVDYLAKGRKNAYYSGWSMIWKIANGNPRNLLELISEIFANGEINNESAPSKISTRNQDRGIRSVSEKRLRSLAQISGVFESNGTKISLGRRIFDITTIIGSVYRIYLRAENHKYRKDQYLAIERNETSELTEVSNSILKELIRYGVFDETRFDIARDDRVKKPIYILNRIFCPAFGIGYRRDQHLRLSRQKFEELLLNPKIFLRDGTRKLRSTELSEYKSENNLFTKYDE